MILEAPMAVTYCEGNDTSRRIRRASLQLSSAGPGWATAMAQLLSALPTDSSLAHAIAERHVAVGSCRFDKSKRCARVRSFKGIRGGLGRDWSLQEGDSLRCVQRCRCVGAGGFNDDAEEEGTVRGTCKEELGGKFDEKRQVFIFGMGYTSLALANTLKRQGWVVSGTCRSGEKKEALELRGFGAHLFDPDNDGGCLGEEAVRELRLATHIVSSIPPVGDFDRDPVLEAHRDELLRAAQGRLQWIGYLSSTSVYGDWQGNWVSEDTEPRPIDRRAMARRQAEKEWLQLSEEAGVCLHVFRLGGIYGPGRSALDAIQRAQNLSERQKFRGRKRFTSRVHVGDICQVLMKSMVCQKRSSRIYNVVDDDPTPRAEVMAFARRLLHGEIVEDNHDDDSVNRLSEELRFSSGADSRLIMGEVASEKRVSNQRVKDELQVQLLHPTFRSGLRAISEGVSNPFD